MNKNILMRIDFQNDFVHPQGDLTISDTDLIKKHQKFANSLQSGMVDLIIDSYDTHFKETYNNTIESKNFPIHCVFGSWGWQSAAPLKDNIEKIDIFKSTTNIWNEKNTYEILSQDFTNKNVYLCGVLSEVCVYQAMKGLLKRGANVIIIEDLCKGINAQVRDILEHSDFQAVKESGQLKSITMAQFFRTHILDKKIEHNLVYKQRGE
ncbi:MAG: cysteine hydrolase family protein [Alphaproteobacteria bacterium]|nr:cysteine hydrolase family protein [Alphaproteobacteria bacterium]